MCVCVSVCVGVRACVRACVSVCVCWGGGVFNVLCVDNRGHVQRVLTTVSAAGVFSQQQKHLSVE